MTGLLSRRQKDMHAPMNAMKVECKNINTKVQLQIIIVNSVYNIHFSIEAAD